MAFADLAWNQSEQNMSSLRGEIYACPAEDIDWTTPPALNADGVTITGDIVCKTGKEFIQLYHTKNSGKVMSEPAGEKDGRYKDNSIEFFFPGNKKAVIAFEKDALNTPWVVIVKEADGTVLVLGVCVDGSGNLHIDWPCDLETASYANEGGNVRGRTFGFKCSAPHSPLVYEGDIQTTPTA